MLQKFKEVLLATGSETLKVRWERNGRNETHHRHGQFIGGMPVLHGGVSLRVDDATGLVDSRVL